MTDVADHNASHGRAEHTHALKTRRVSYAGGFPYAKCRGTRYKSATDFR